MRVIVAGGTGFLGRPLVVGLLAAGHEVTTLTRAARGQSAGREVEWHPNGAAGASDVASDVGGARADA